jgi:thioredoxin 1
MKLLLVLSGLLLLASCTQTQTPSPVPTPLPKAMEEKKMMAEPIKKDMMPSNTTKTETMSTPANTMEKAPMTDAVMKTESMAKPAETMMKEELKMMKSTGYMSYDEAKVKAALASGQKVALFFHATWCPSCKALDGTINASLSAIPADTLIVKVDYDTSTEMKKKYGVTSQHTTVLIDKDMNLISKKRAAKTVAEVLN